jgi:uncharacterized lipoprotein YehR (DUF1307 family)
MIDRNIVPSWASQDSLVETDKKILASSYIFKNDKGVEEKKEYYQSEFKHTVHINNESSGLGRG